MAMVTTDKAREGMLAALGAGSTYQFLTLAAPYLHVCPDDDYVRLMAVREYLRLGLAGPARELLDDAPNGAVNAEELTALRKSLSSMPSGLLAWQASASRFEDNLSALRQRGVPTAGLELTWRQRQNEFQRFRDANGVEQVRRRTADNQWRWIPALSHHHAVDQARAMPDGVGGHMPGPYLFEGLDLGGYFERVYTATRNTFLGYSCALFVVEPDAAMLAMVLHLRDWHEILSDGRTFWCFGEDWQRQLRTHWAEDADLPFPRQAFHMSLFRPRPQPGAVEVVEQAGMEREREIRASLGDLNRRYANRDDAYWSWRFEEALSGCGSPLRVLAAVSTHTTFLQYSMRDALRALESLGHQCVLLTEKTPYGITGPLTYHDAIRKLNPDVFFVLDHLRPEFEGFLPENLPVLTWDQDQLPHVFTRMNMMKVARKDFVVGCSKGIWVRSGGDSRQFLHARLPTCPEQFGGEPLTAAETQRYACDVSFVSHASQSGKEFYEAERANQRDPQLRRVLDGLYELLPEALSKHRVAGGWVAEQLLEEVARRCGVIIHDHELRTWLKSWFVWRLGDRLFRHEALEWVGAWATRTGRSFRIYGHGWEKHSTLSAFAAGPAENGRELLCVYRASRINLQLMPAGFIHQRALDGLAGGGFFMTRLVPTDVRGKAMRRLITRVRELGLGSSREILNSSDPAVRQAMSDYYGPWLHRMDPNSDDLYHDIGLSGELEYPDEVFPDFPRIVFDSAEEFAAAADSLLANDDLRREIANRMRRVVVERFSYRPAMDRFLRGMAAWLKCVAP